MPGRPAAASPVRRGLVWLRRLALAFAAIAFFQV